MAKVVTVLVKAAGATVKAPGATVKAPGATVTGPEIIVAVTPVPVVTPAWVPEVARTPSRKRARVGLSIDCAS
jgi:hypothetical protein